ncbi:MAG: MFS transporter [Candidatus Promineifilaceae bacterium]|nr:MFS transporter [Candidatus Promineifilaceae bacterium]
MANIVGLATGLSLLGDSALYTVLATHTADVGVGLASVGLLLSVNRFIRLGLNGPIGWLIDRTSRRRVFVPALYLGAFSTVTYALADGLTPMLVGRLMWGVSWAAVWVGGNTIILDVSRPGRRGRQVGAYHFSFFLGAAAGALVGGLVTDWLGFDLAMLAAAMLAVVGAIVAHARLPETGRFSRAGALAQAEENSHPHLADTDQRTQLASAMALFGTNRVVIAGIFVPTLGLYLAERFGSTVRIAGLSVGNASLTGAALSLSTIGAMAATLFSGALSDRARSRWIVVTAGIISGLGGFVLLIGSNLLALPVGLAAVSLSSGSNQSLSTALVGDLTARQQQGVGLGALFTVGDLGSAIGPPLAFWLLPHIGVTGLYRICIVLLLVFLLLAASWSWRQRAEQSASIQQPG